MELKGSERNVTIQCSIYNKQLERHKIRKIYYIIILLSLLYIFSNASALKLPHNTYVQSTYHFIDDRVWQ